MARSERTSGRRRRSPRRAVVAALAAGMLLATSTRQPFAFDRAAAADAIADASRDERFPTVRIARKSAPPAPAPQPGAPSVLDPAPSAASPQVELVTPPNGVSVPAAERPAGPRSAEVAQTPIARLSIDIAPPGGEMPHDYAAERTGDAVRPLNSAQGVVVGAPFYSTPRAAGFVHRPLYFEERAAERHGRSWGALQPIASGIHFFGTLPVLPYKQGAQPQRRVVQTGDGVRPPSDRLTPRQHLRGIVTEATTVTGLIFTIP